MDSRERKTRIRKHTRTHEQLASYLQVACTELM